MKGQSRPVPPTTKPLHLAELLDFRPDQGIIRLHEQRVVILSAAAMGLLRKELVDTLGIETARRLLLRFGFADGYHDAVSLRDRSNWASPEEGLRSGAMLHTLEGIVHADVIRIEHDESTGRFEEEVIWRDSYEAEQHVHHYGKSDVPVCWSLAGYASGYVSACIGQEIYFRENECLAQGAPKCSVIGRDAASWGDALEALRFDFQSADLGQEVERVRDAVHKRLQELDRRERQVDWSSCEGLTECLAALVFEGIAEVKYRGLDTDDTARELTLLTIATGPGKEHLIHIDLVFEADAQIQLRTDRIDCRLDDFGAPEPCKVTPCDHLGQGWIKVAPA